MTHEADQRTLRDAVLKLAADEPPLRIEPAELVSRGRAVRRRRRGGIATVAGVLALGAGLAVVNSDVLDEGRSTDLVIADTGSPDWKERERQLLEKRADEVHEKVVEASRSLADDLGRGWEPSVEAGDITPSVALGINAGQPEGYTAVASREVHIGYSGCREAGTEKGTVFSACEQLDVAAGEAATVQYTESGAITSKEAAPRVAVAVHLFYQRHDGRGVEALMRLTAPVSRADANNMEDARRWLELQVPLLVTAASSPDIEIIEE